MRSPRRMATGETEGMTPHQVAYMMEVMAMHEGSPRQEELMLPGGEKVPSELQQLFRELQQYSLNQVGSQCARLHSIAGSSPLSACLPVPWLLHYSNCIKYLPPVYQST